ncbi:MAG: VanW family protein [candidate division WWE3 bacterium GW2011_GWF2_41_45]|uniref:VanW family protein n=3 Tax=Katanobacteria TaxID=422282 RepID=A0A0G0VST9_UNCKA|nr:MAG: VanW family protein [candidate division WWE3 bacterium GW2011_GWC2_41_23]KKS10033.1 MAG: VanW family protein [candidate division WWE3 bacterium GW2011_GWF2_41_45]KKS11993.1 MAG: VanW family protein [candidate division WWE3 bacterium GW2011_GWF1_41_53]KKS19883.1 MAG: VanW family protein [candidate division WWE3 bacterium GW2011_GWE1_41_72]KKS28921.1 MAG: VanW family protein [candidate division WWE3 bacterium GW2011_GWD2_42_11]KKS50355.1 MAG: VanW family protein [candidate division WWE3 
MPTLQQKIKDLAFSSVSKRILFFVYFLLLVATFYHIYYAKRIIPGVTVGDVSLGGKNLAQAQSALEAREKTLDKKVTLKYDGKEYAVKAEDIDLTYDWEGTVLRAFEIGRTGNILRDSKDKIAGLVKNLSIPAYHDHSDEKLISVLSEAKSLFNVIAQNAGVKMEKGKLVVTPESEGKKVLDDASHTTVIQAFDNLSFGDKELPGKKIVPKISTAEVTALLPQAEKIINNEITVKDGSKTWKLTSEQLLGYITFQRDKEKNHVEIDILKPRLEAFVEELEQEVNQLPRGQVTSMNSNKVTGFVLSKEGSEVDREKFIAAFRDAYFNSKSSIEIPKSSVSGPLDKDKYGILELLGEGKSTYKGSAAGRIHNLTLAAERASGVLVAPGAIYSLNNSVGEIDAKTGYDIAYIIKDGRTVLGSGGGVCQTSTTLFRAVLNTGLPIVMRYPHAYRVSYYEQDQPVGFDAAIYQPSWDLRFKNDTDNYILVQAEADIASYALKFQIFGTPDGRKVAVTEPVVSNQSPPPPALYQDDPTLAKGVTKQVDFPAWGAKVTYSRTVTRGDEELFVDNFESRYQPWRAVYLVGTKE